MNSDSRQKRVFFSLLPDPRTMEAISFHANQYSPDTGRKVRAENFHITLLFLGNVAIQTIDKLCMDCDSLASPSFELLINSPGWWKKSGILWLGPKDIPNALDELHQSLKSLAGRHRIPTDNKPYVPHITLMRKVREAPENPVVKPFTWTADSFTLMESETMPDGARYTELASWPLK